MTGAPIIDKHIKEKFDALPRFNSQSEGVEESGGLDARESTELAARARLKPLSLAEIRNQPARRYLIKGLLGAGEMSVWYGDAGCGKSFLLLETARCITTGQLWFDRKTIQGAVLYIMCVEVV